MKRRRFLFGSLGVLGGGTLLVGGGAQSRIESHRNSTVETVGDDNAYVGLVYRPFVTINGDACEATIDLITITNQSKLVLDDFTVELSFADPDGFTITDLSLPDSLEIGESAPVEVTISASEPVSTTATYTVSATITGTDPASGAGTDDEGRFELHREREIEIETDCPVPGPGISILAFVPEDQNNIDQLKQMELTTVAENRSGEITGVEWTVPDDAGVIVKETVVYGGQEWYLCEGGTSGIAGTNSNVFDNCYLLDTGTTISGDVAYRCPESPGDGERSAKFENGIPGSPPAFEEVTKANCQNIDDKDRE